MAWHPLASEHQIQAPVASDESGPPMEAGQYPLQVQQPQQEENWLRKEAGMLMTEEVNDQKPTVDVVVEESWHLVEQLAGWKHCQFSNTSTSVNLHFLLVIK